jgi:hypothetical protein
MNYKKLNIIVGWFTFLVAAITYMMTLEPRASFWDCGEFITTAFKFEVGHPPGAPLFMIVGRFFTLFGNAMSAAFWMNVLSALASAFTILFLFWTITHLTKRLFTSENEPSTGEMIAILGSGLIGGLAYTFSDTFWFSAVEAEVYGTSSFFTAIVFWAILKWENVADEKHSNRWIILICYLAGLSIGVHLLNLLAIPAIVFIYYYKKYDVTKKGIAYALIISGIILGFVLYGIIPGVVKLATFFERIFVNGVGLPVNTGSFIYLILIIAAIAYGIYYTHKNGKVLLNTIILGLTVILIGFSTYMVVPIRSSAHTPMDQNSPSNAFAMLSFLNREQYGDRPLFYGQYYNSPLDRNEQTVHSKDEYRVRNGKYVVTNEQSAPNYDKSFCTFFPRMWSKSDPKHEEAYKEWGKIKGTRMTFHNPSSGETETIIKPTFAENLRFFFRYQVNFMYTRYFMWNFVGRQNDIQGNGNLIDGNWISGIKFIDQARLGNQDNLPSKYADNPGRNKYYFLPLLLGLLGILFQYRSGTQGKRDLWIVTLLFVATGLAIVVYLNQYPFQPRERDYAFAGSFYAFAIWIGMGVAWLYKLLKKFAPETISAVVVTIVSLLAVPVLMASQNWDDHNRSKRTSAPDMGYNYLASVQPNGIIFTNGDNDTYPLWYNQEVEGVGVDKRVCNLSYLQTDWYVNQMQRKAYTSEPLPISFKYDQYVQGTRDVVYIMEDPRLKGKSIELGKALEFIKDDNPRTKITQYDNAAYLPVKKLYMVVDKKAVISNGVVAPKDYDKIVDTMFIDIPGSYIAKDQLMILDMLYTNNWKRPIYYAISVGADKYLSLDKYFRLEGLANRIVPILSKSSGYQRGFEDTDLMYDNFMNKFRWGGIKLPGVYADENNRRMLTNMRNNFSRLAEALLREGKKEKCIKILDKCIEEIPANKVPYDYFSVQIAKVYLNAGEKEKAIKLIRDMSKEFSDELNYFFSFNKKDYPSFDDEMRSNLYFLNELQTVVEKSGNTELQSQIKASFDKYYDQLIAQ